MTRKDSVVARAAEELGIVAHGQSVPARRKAVLDQAFDDALSEMRREGVVWWSADGTPNYAAEPLAKFIAGRVAGKFFKDQSTLLMMMNKGADGERRLRRLKSNDEPSDEPVHQDYF